MYTFATNATVGMTKVAKMQYYMVYFCKILITHVIDMVGFLQNALLQI